MLEASKARQNGTRLVELKKRHCLDSFEDIHVSSEKKYRKNEVMLHSAGKHVSTLFNPRGRREEKHSSRSLMAD